MAKHNESGKLAERVARFLLVSKGYRIVAINVTAPRGSGAGEIDLVAEKNGLLAFVEVKKRTNKTDALYAITSRQQARIEAGAALFIARNPEYHGHDIRFDVVVLSNRLVPKHITDAWRPES